jgi:hypothetical protein
MFYFSRRICKHYTCNPTEFTLEPGGIQFIDTPLDSINLNVLTYMAQAQGGVFVLNILYYTRGDPEPPTQYIHLIVS